MTTSYHLILSPRAQADIQSIYDYTRVSYTDNQAAKYIRKIEAALNGLRENPELGRARNDIKAGYRSLLVEKHVLFYKIEGVQIQILGVLHCRMDVMNYFTAKSE